MEILIEKSKKQPQGGIFMEEETWKQFMSTGRVTDYLAYKQTEKETGLKQKAGREYGTEPGIDGDGAVSASHRGLR